jgi:hypothetical protein
MKPIDFPASNVIIANEIPANRSHNITLSRWKLSWSERFSVFFYGKIWHATKGRYMSPTLISGNQDFEIKSSNEMD